MITFDLALNFALSYLLTGVLLVVLALLVLWRGPRRSQNRWFAFYSFAIAWWAICSIPLILARDYAFGMFWDRLCLAGAVLIPVSFLGFILSYLELQSKHTLLLRLAFGVSLIFLSLVFSSSLVLKGLGPRDGIRFFTEPGPGYLLFVCYFASTATWGIWLLWKSYKSSQDLQIRSQLSVLFWTSLVGYFGGSANYMLVFGFAPTQIAIVGNYAVAIYAAMVAYIITRYRFLDIEVAVKRSLVFAGLVVALVSVVSLITFVSQDLLSAYIAVPRQLANALSAVVIAASYGKLHGWLTNVTDRYLFQKKYDYKELLKKFTDEVMVIVDLKQLLKMTVNTLVETIKLQSCALLLSSRNGETYEVAASLGVTTSDMRISDDSVLIRFLAETHEPILTGGKVTFPPDLLKDLESLGAEISLPLHVHEELIGVLCLGKKKSDSEFTEDDLDILLPLARTLAISISNAQLFDELAKTQAEAAQREKLAVIGTLSAGINHEICNPLGIIKTQTEAFLLDQQDGLLKDTAPEKLMERVSSIFSNTLKQIDRATAITQKLSNFAKPIKEPTSQPVSVEHEVDEVLTLVGHDLKLERIEVAKDLPKDLPPIVVDRRQLQEVLFNLIRNAGQAIAPPGRISVRARLYRDELVRIEIEDTGSGISPDKLSKIYDPFFTTKEPGKGTGLGLFIVRQIVERNKGRISVESTVGKGTTFFLDFMAAKPTPVTAK
jgi:signal transduction histidine kinase